MINSKDKGKRGEREWAKFLTDNGFPARRGQQFKGTADSPDVEGGIPFTHAEVKFTERLRLYEALEQSDTEADVKEVPYIAHRTKRKPWVVILYAEDFLDICRDWQDKNEVNDENTDA